MKYQLMTPERLDAIREALKTKSRRQVLREFNVSCRTLTKYEVYKAPADDRRLANITPEQVEIIRRLSAEGASDSVTANAAGTSRRQVRRAREKHGIKVDFSKRPAAQAAEKPTKPKWRNPMKDLGTWRPMADLTTLDAAVTSLRTRFCPVHAEDTARKRFETPKPYGPETLFRIGSLRDVTAEQLMAMAGEVRRAA